MANIVTRGQSANRRSETDDRNDPLKQSLRVITFLGEQGYTATEAAHIMIYALTVLHRLEGAVTIEQQAENVRQGKLYVDKDLVSKPVGAGVN
jgi:hypothetical protein